MQVPKEKRLDFLQIEWELLARSKRISEINNSKHNSSRNSLINSIALDLKFR